jgi:hypothetical protein
MLSSWSPCLSAWAIAARRTRFLLNGFLVSGFLLTPLDAGTVAM